MKRRTMLKVLPALMGVPCVATAAMDTHIRIGLTAVILADQVAFLTRWGAYLSARTGARVSFTARESYQEILDLLFGGQLEAAWICGYPFVQQRERLELLSVPIYQGRPLYRSYLIRPIGQRDPIQGWAGLRQRVLAYSDPLSNSGWLVPQAQLRAAGVKTGDLRRAFFAHGHRNVAEAVSARLADAGCIDGYVWDTMLRQNMAAAERTEVVWRSDLYGFPPLVVRSGTAAETTQWLRDALQAMSNDSAGRALLEALNLDGFAQESASIFASIGVLSAEQERAS